MILEIVLIIAALFMIGFFIVNYLNTLILVRRFKKLPKDEQDRRKNPRSDTGGVQELNSQPSRQRLLSLPGSSPQNTDEREVREDSISTRKGIFGKLGFKN